MGAGLAESFFFLEASWAGRAGDRSLCSKREGPEGPLRILLRIKKILAHREQKEQRMLLLHSCTTSVVVRHGDA